ncbi:transcriptional regulator with XRE-family HTH domain [Staphylococcus hominis]
MLSIETSKKIGNLLKEARKERKISANKLVGKIKYSQSHISGIENGSKLIPSKSFISKYLRAITNDNFSEVNYYINQINELANGEIELATYIDESTSLMDAFVNNFESDSSKLNTFVEELQNGDNKKDYYNFPINDLKFHLIDMNNQKYFNKVLLSADDREHIKEYIENYIELKYKIYLNQINDLYSKNKLDEKSYKQEYYQIDRILKAIKGDNYGKL